MTTRALLPLFLVLFLLPAASAHASLQSASPQPNGHADAGVSVIEVRFTEDVEPQYTTLGIVDLKQKDWANGPAQFDDAHHNVVRLRVDPLLDGVYTVNWRALSVDSHTTQGSFLFSVGAARLTYTPPLSAHDHTDDQAQVLREGAARWAYYGCMFIGIGTPVFLSVMERARMPALAPTLLTAVAAIAGAVAAYVGLLFLAERTGLSFTQASHTAAGSSFDWRGTLLVAAGIAFVVAVAIKPARRPALLIGAALAGGSLVWASLGSHAAAGRELHWASVTMDVLHLLMGALWVGGVAAFLFAARGKSGREVGLLIARFTPLAIASVAVILVTGTYASVRHIPRVADLWMQPYGRLVSLKIILFVVLLALGAYNKQVVMPRLLSSKEGTAGFRRVLALEAILMAVVVGAAGALASSSPPDKAVEEGTQGVSSYAEFAQATATTHVVMSVSPNPITVGIQNLTIELHPLSVTAVGKGASIAVKVSAPGASEPGVFFEPGPKRLADDTWAMEDGIFTSPGSWNVWVLVQRPEVSEFSKLHFTVPVEVPS
ncbi:MAG: CopD family protein [Candidatus Thermoplasmatota archaeon]